MLGLDRFGRVSRRRRWLVNVPCIRQLSRAVASNNLLIRPVPPSACLPQTSYGSYSIRYGFSQPFNLPAETAYQWCTDFAPDDWGRMGKEGTRKIKRINEDTLILTDTVIVGEGKGRRPVTKQRLVRLNRDRMAWTNTHLTGPNKHSQFWYHIVAEAEDRSRLDFTGLQITKGCGLRDDLRGIGASYCGLTREARPN